MDKKIKIGAIIFCVFMFFGTCSTMKKVGELSDDLIETNEALRAEIKALAAKNDSLMDAQSQELEKTLELKFYDFLVAEDEIDKGKLTFSQLKQRIDEED